MSFIYEAVIYARESLDKASEVFFRQGVADFFVVDKCMKHSCVVSVIVGEGDCKWLSFNTF